MKEYGVLFTRPQRTQSLGSTIYTDYAAAEAAVLLHNTAVGRPPGRHAEIILICRSLEPQ